MNVEIREINGEQRFFIPAPPGSGEFFRRRLRVGAAIHRAVIESIPEGERITLTIRDELGIPWPGARLMELIHGTASAIYGLVYLGRDSTDLVDITDNVTNIERVNHRGYASLLAEGGVPSTDSMEVSVFSGNRPAWAETPGRLDTTGTDVHVSTPLEPHFVLGENRLGSGRLSPTRTHAEEPRKFIDGPGLFKKGIKMFKVPDYKTQCKKINALKEVKSWGAEEKVAELNLEKYGCYVVKIGKPVIARREKKGKYKTFKRKGNPFISTENTLCLGEGLTTFMKQLTQENYYECLRITIKVLTCDDDSNGYRAWRECK